MEAPATARLAKRARRHFKPLQTSSDAATVSYLDLGLASHLFILKRGETNACVPVKVQEICEAGHRRPRVYACALRKCPGDTCRHHALEERRRVLSKLMCGSSEKVQSPSGDEWKETKAAVFPGAWSIVTLPYAKSARPALQWSGLLAKSRGGAAVLLQEWALGLNGLAYRDGWRLGVVSVDHPEGDKTPGEWKPHHNFMFPAIAFHRDGRRAALRYHVSKDDLTRLRRLWRWWQERVVLGERLHTKGNVFYQFAIDRKKKRHAARYFPRSFPSWPGAGQRLSYFGAFSCRSLNALPEVQAVKKESPMPAGFCVECGAATHVVLDESGNLAGIPAHYRAVTGGSSP